MERLIVFVFCLVLFSCSSAKTINEQEHPVDTTAVPENVITFSVEGQEVKTTAWNIARFQFYNMDAPGLNITSNMHEEKRTVRFNLEDYRPGVYTLDGSPLEGGSYGSYMPDYWHRGMTYPITGGSVVLSEVDTVRKVVNGTFHFTAARDGDTVRITDGKIINGTLNLDISGKGK